MIKHYAVRRDQPGAVSLIPHRTRRTADEDRDRKKPCFVVYVLLLEEPRNALYAGVAEGQKIGSKRGSVAVTTTLKTLLVLVSWGPLHQNLDRQFR